MAKCNTKLFYGCCPSVTPVDPEENKKPEDSKKEEQKPDVQPVPTPVPPKPCCHDFNVQHITVVGDEVFVILDDCTFLKAPLTVLDKSVGTAKDEMDKANVTELQKALTELTEKVKALESKEDKDTIFDPESLIGRIAALEGKEDKDTVYDDTAIRNLIEALQNKEDKDTVFDPTAINERLAALEAKEDKDTVFDPAILEERITALEGKADKDTVYDDSALAARVKALEDSPAGEKVDTTKFVRKDELVDVQNWAGTTRFKAYPVDVKTGESTPNTVHPDDKL